MLIVCLLVLVTFSFSRSSESTTTTTILCSERARKGRADGASREDEKMIVASIAVGVDEGTSGKHNEIACSYSIASIRDEAIYFCQTFSRARDMDVCVKAVDASLRSEVDAGPLPLLISRNHEERGPRLLRVPYTVSGEGHTRYQDIYEGDNVTEIVRELCGGQYASESYNCANMLFSRMFAEPKTRAMAIDAFVQCCNASEDEEERATYDMSGTFVDPGVGRAHIVDDSLPADLFCMIASEALDAFRMMSRASRRGRAHTHFLELTDLLENGPRTAIELGILKLFHTDFPSDGSNDILGAEWWLQVRHGGPEIGFHFDKDEGYAEQNHEERCRVDARCEVSPYRHPVLSTVTYLTANTRKILHRGDRSAAPPPQGPTLVFNKRGTDDVGDGDLTDALVVFPKPNRHLTFAGDLFHGVPQVFSDDDMSRDGATGMNVRVTLLVNWWDRRPMEYFSPTMSDEEAAELINYQTTRHRRLLMSMIERVSTRRQLDDRELARRATRVPVQHQTSWTWDSPTIRTRDEGNAVSRALPLWLIAPFRLLSSGPFRHAMPVERDLSVSFVKWNLVKEFTRHAICIPNNFDDLKNCISLSSSSVKSRRKMLVLVIQGNGSLSRQGMLTRMLYETHREFSPDILVAYVNRKSYQSPQSDDRFAFEKKDLKVKMPCASMYEVAVEAEITITFRCREQSCASCVGISIKDGTRLRRVVMDWLEASAMSSVPRLV